MILTFAKFITLAVWSIFWITILIEKNKNKGVVSGMFLGNPGKSSTYGIFIFFTALHTILWVNNPVFLNGLKIEWALAIAFFGSIFLLTAAILGTWSVHELGKSFSISTSTNESSPLIKNGPYAHVRHPIYLMFILIWLGSSMVFVDPIGIAMGIILVPLIHSRIKKEEINLLSKYGQEYSDYRERTGRLFLKLI